MIRSSVLYQGESPAEILQFLPQVRILFFQFGNIRLSRFIFSFEIGHRMSWQFRTTLFWMSIHFCVLLERIMATCHAIETERRSHFSRHLGAERTEAEFTGARRVKVSEPGVIS